MADRCEITELPVGQCACRVHGKPESAAERVRTALGIGAGWFGARYPGVCKACRRPFQPGARITGTDGSDGWTTECCACAEAKYRAMCEFYGTPPGRTEWRPASARRPGVQDLYVTHPERRFEPEQFCRADESVIRVEVQP